MPNRIIKESIRTSKKVNALNDFQFRVWTYLITYVDDFGRGSADPEILKGMVFTRRKGVTEAQIAKALSELANIGMVILYESDGEPFFYFPNWGKHQTIRNKRSRFPNPEECQQLECNCLQVDSNIEAIASVIQSESESKIENPNPKDTRKRVCMDTVSMFLELSQGNEVIKPIEDTVIQWLQYKEELHKGGKKPYTSIGLRSLITQIEKHIMQSGASAVADCIELSMSNNYQGIVWEKLRDIKPQHSQSDSRDWENA